MIYADGETVTYTYNAGGLLRSMDGKKKSATFSYVKQLGYDKFEQRVFLAYGNGTKTTYNYEPDRRRLKKMTAETTAKRVFMDNTYTYDKVNNILEMKNNAAIPASNLMGGSSEYSYEYDDLYRLTKAQGSFKGSNAQHTYNLSMSYNSVGGITQNTQVHKSKDQEQKKTTYDLNYTYGDTQPHAPVHIGEQTYTYDPNGNQLGWKDDKTGQERKIMWDEENRIRSIYDNGSQHHYIYDASGERVIKGKSTGQRIFVNGEWKAGSGGMGNYTVYVNPYLVLKSGGYSKHYYIEGQRIVSKLGGGWDNTKNVKAGGDKVDYNGKTQKIFDGIVKNLKFLGADGQILTAGKSGKVPPGQLNGTATGNVNEAFRYFYHPDHLESTSYVTDASGEVYQHLEYMAFGETFVEEHSNTDRTPYLFNGKELDEETGLYYYGARYYDARTSVWLSVDPLAEKYPTWTPYAYAFNNPINYIDPTGMEGEDPPSKEKAKAIEVANKFASKNPGDSYGYKDSSIPQPGDSKVDCSGLVRSCLKEATGKDPFNTGKSQQKADGTWMKGVEVLVSNPDLEKIDLTNAQVGDVLTLNNSKSGTDKSKDVSHTGIITELERGENGETLNLKMVDSGGTAGSGTSGPRASNLIVNGENKYWGNRITGVYTWGNDNKIYDGGALAPITITGSRLPADRKLPTLAPIPKISVPILRR
jgi:RHS repeat-associated protein